MFEYLESIDRSIVLAVNSWNNPFLDQFFWIVTQTTTWIPFYALLIYLIWKNRGLRTGLIFLVMVSLMIGIVDSTTTLLFKDTIMRYRPSHNLLLEKHLHYYMEDGILYAFSWKIAGKIPSTFQLYLLPITTEITTCSLFRTCMKLTRIVKS